MMNAQLVKGFLMGFILTASAAAGAQEYPAADFQPKVLYRDSSIAEVAPASAPTAAASNANAPCPQKQESSEVDAKYPAASFQPKVLFSAAGS